VGNCGWSGLATVGSGWGESGMIWLRGSSDVWVFAHELGHNLGLYHSGGLHCTEDGVAVTLSSTCSVDAYFDPWDIMSANNIFTFLDWRNLRNGPEANSINKRALGLVPEHRKQILVEDPSRWITTTVQVAAINRPEANAPLFVEIRKANGSIFTIEFRMKDGLDAGIPRTTVMVHKRESSGRSVLTTAGEASGWNPERLPGNSYTISGLGTVTVDSFAASGYTAQVQVRY